MVDHKNVLVSKRLVAINATGSVCARVLNVTVLVWMYQYLLKRIPPEEFAVYPVVTAVMVFAPLFFTFFSGGISRFVIDAYAKGEFEEVSRIVSSILPMLVAAGAVFLAVGLFFAANIEHVLNIAPDTVDDAKLMMGLLIANFSLQMVLQPYVIGYQVRQRYVELSLLAIFRDLIRIVLLLIFLLGISPNVIWVVIATVISEVVYLAVTAIRSRRMVPELRFNRSLFAMKRAWDLMSFGLWTAVGRLGTVMYSHAATIVLNLYGSAVDVTGYYIASSFYRQLLGMIQTASVPLQPAITGMNALDDRSRLASTVLRGGRYSLWVSLLVATPIALYADPLIELYLGDKYSVTATVLVLFMIIFPFTQPTQLLGMTAMAMAQVRAFFLPAFLFQLLGLVLMVIFAVYLNMGAVGVTLGLVGITIGSQIFYFWWLCLKLIRVDFSNFIKRVLIPGLGPALAGLVIWSGLEMLRPPDNWILLGLYSSLGAVVYVGVLLGFCLNQDDRKDLRALLSRVGLIDRN